MNNTDFWARLIEIMQTPIDEVHQSIADALLESSDGLTKEEKQAAALREAKKLLEARASGDDVVDRAVNDSLYGKIRVKIQGHNDETA